MGMPSSDSYGEPWQGLEGGKEQKAKGEKTVRVSEEGQDRRERSAGVLRGGGCLHLSSVAAPELLSLH